MKHLWFSLVVSLSLSACFSYKAPPERGVQCADGIDNDGNGAPDCADAQCANEPLCAVVTCPNGALDTGEQCDDNNNNNNDGCSAVCQTESGFECSGQPSVCILICGNGVINAGEQCDGAALGGNDCTTVGNFEGGTLACDPQCELDTTLCIAPNQENCAVVGDEDGNGLSDCADAACAAAPQCIEAGNCEDNLDNDGNGAIDCDDPQCGADAACTETGAECEDNIDNDGDGLTDCVDPDCDNEPTCDPCGDGSLTKGEQCDDANNADNDGCSAACQTESGFECVGQPSVCVLICGNGVIDTGEQCDDNNTTDNDGCDAGCQTESGFECVGQPSVCTPADVNDAPSFDFIADQLIDEDENAGVTLISITGIIAGPSNEAGQLVTLTATSSDPNIVPNPIDPVVSGGDATLTLTPIANASGTVSIIVTATDNGGTANGGDDTFSRVFTLEIVPVADLPSLTTTDATGSENTAIPVLIDASLTDLDGSETLSVVIDGIPAGSVLSSGTLSTSGGGFAAAGNFTAGTNPSSVTVGKFNADAFDDLAVTNINSNTASVFFGDGVGGFGAAVNLSTGARPRLVTVGRFNADAVDDLAVANDSSNNVTIFLGNGVSGFGAPNNFSAADPFWVTVGNFNADTFQDLAVANATTNNVSILLGNGNGGFSAPSNFQAGTNPRSVTVGRFNADAFDDLAVANFGSNNVSILFGNGNGGFSAPSNFVVGASPRGVTVGRFNADSFDDLVVANSAASSVSILLGDGNGGFSASSDFASDAGSFSVTVGRFNADAFQDLAVANPTANNVSILLGDGNGSFGAPDNFPAGTSPNSVAVGRLNGDTIDDLAVSNSGSNNVSVLLQIPSTASVTLTEAELAGLTLTPPAGFEGEINLTVTATATENFDSASTAPVPLTITVTTLVAFSAFFEGVPGATPEQCNAWNDFRADLNGSFTKVTIRGSLDPIGVSCTGANANTLCAALHNATTTGVISCDGRNWGVRGDNCTVGTFPAPAVELTASMTADINCTCDQGPTVRPCIGLQNWGGINETCEAASQTLEVICE